MPSIQNGGLIYGNYDKSKAWGDPRNRCRVGGLACGYTVIYVMYNCNDKILTYGPNNNVFTDQIRPFIHMYFRRTILSGPKPIKSTLSQGDILFEIFYLFSFSDKKPSDIS